MSAIWTREDERLYGERLGTAEFEREAYRRSKIRRELDCGHSIPAGIGYLYTVAKLRGIRSLIQTRTCDFCMRSRNRY